jgi:pantetheine-phosphate adenylyltransferase
MSDFEYEFQLALMNRKLNRKVQSVFLMTDYKWFYVSSTIIKEAACLGGDINGLVPALVRDNLANKYPALAKRLTKAR